jgi:hypothetical protein
MGDDLSVSETELLGMLNANNLLITRLYAAFVHANPDVAYMLEAMESTAGQLRKSPAPTHAATGKQLETCLRKIRLDLADR